MINKNRIALVIAVMFFALGSSVIAQPAAPQNGSAATSAQPTAVNLPPGKVAVIFSAAFQDAKLGIAKFTVIQNKLNAEFQKTQEDLNQTAQKIQALESEITKAQATPAAPDAKLVQAKVDQLDQMKKDYQRKGEDAQAGYKRRREEIFAPLQEEVGKALDTYAKSRGIILVIDASQVEGILFVSDGIDITRAFVAEYNSKNPVTASATTPK